MNMRGRACALATGARRARPYFACAAVMFIKLPLK
jgi:hypothetical protein